MNRKLMGEIDRTMKRVAEGIEAFEQTWTKVYGAQNPSQKEKYESDLKKEIKKLQRYREQIKGWLQSNDVKEKSHLLEARKAIEAKMERFKKCEKETKTKAYSKEGLGQQAKADPLTQAKMQVSEWVGRCLVELRTQIDQMEAQLEASGAGPGSPLVPPPRRGKHGSKQRAQPMVNPEEVAALNARVTAHNHHIDMLEHILRVVENDILSPRDVEEIRPSMDYYIESNQDPDFMEDEDIYEGLEGLGLDDENDGAVGTPPSTFVGASGTAAVPPPAATASPASSAQGAAGSSAAGAATAATPVTATAAVAAAAATTVAATTTAAATAGSDAMRSPSGNFLPAPAVPQLAMSRGRGALPAPSGGFGTGEDSAKQRSRHQDVQAGVDASSRSRSPASHMARVEFAQKEDAVPGSSRSPAAGGHSLPISPSVSVGGADAGRKSGTGSQGHPPLLTLPSRMQSTPVGLGGPVEGFRSAPAAAGGGATVAFSGRLSPPVLGSSVSSAGALGETPRVSSGLASHATVPQRVTPVVSAPAAVYSQAGIDRQPGPPLGPPSKTFGHTRPAVAHGGDVARVHAQPLSGPAAAVGRGVPVVPQQMPSGRAPMADAAPGGSEEPAAGVSASSTGSPEDAFNFGSESDDATMDRLAARLAAMENELAETLLQAPGSDAKLDGAASRKSCHHLRSSSRRFELLETSMIFLPSGADSTRYVREGMGGGTSSHSADVPPSEFQQHVDPSRPTSIFDAPALFEKFDVDLLFFIFFFQPGTYQQYLAACELKSRSWRFHKKYLTWFQRLEEPRVSMNSYEEGTYVYFDYETGWFKRKKADFVFEYKYLEDVL